MDNEHEYDEHRFFQKDGSVRIKRKGVGLLQRISWFQSLVQMRNARLWLSLFGIYIFLNLIFAGIYLIVGVQNIEGIGKGTDLVEFEQAFFFSAQTFTTVGYGHVIPVGTVANIIAAIEAFLGLLFFAMLSGIFYARFAKPRSYLRFSKVALTSHHKGAKALIFRVVPYKDHYLVDAEVKVSLVVRNKTGHNDFFALDVEQNCVDALVLNWTIFHPVVEGSPLFGKSMDDLKNDEAGIFVFLKAHDEVYATAVVARTSYNVKDIIENARFKRMYHPSENGKETVLRVDMLNDYEMVEKELKMNN